MLSNSRLVNIVLGTLLLMIFAAQGYWVTRPIGRTTPITVLEAVAVKSTIPAGTDVLEVRFKVWRHRLCAVDTDRFILRYKDQAIVARERVLGIGAGVTNNPVEVFAKVNIPSNLEPGQYIFRGFLFSNCGLNDFHGLQQPDIVFTIK